MTDPTGAAGDGTEREIEAEAVSSRKAAVGAAFARIRQEPFDPEPGRERLRGSIALALIALFVIVVLLAFLLFLLTDPPIGDLKDFLIVVVPPVTSLVSAVVGFYYGSSTRGRD